MKKILVLFFAVSICSGAMPAQDLFSKFNFTTVLSADQFGETMKIIWEEVKNNVDAFYAKFSTKREFESTAAFENRIQRERNQMAMQIQKIISDNMLDSRQFIVSMKARLIKYDADNQTYSITSPNKANLPPSKDHIRFTCSNNSYVTVQEKNEAGYRRSYLVLKTKPDFTWYVDPQMALKAKNSEGNLYFKMWFSLVIDISKPEYVNIQLIPKKISLVDTAQNFTYWTEEL